jgi:hypothetical protein
MRTPPHQRPAKGIRMWMAEPSKMAFETDVSTAAFGIRTVLIGGSVSVAGLQNTTDDDSAPRPLPGGCIVVAGLAGILAGLVMLMGNVTAVAACSASQQAIGTWSALSANCRQLPPGDAAAMSSGGEHPGLASGRETNRARSLLGFVADCLRKRVAVVREGHHHDEACRNDLDDPATQSDRGRRLSGGPGLEHVPAEPVGRRIRLLLGPVSCRKESPWRRRCGHGERPTSHGRDRGARPAQRFAALPGRNRVDGYVLLLAHQLR